MILVVVVLLAGLLTVGVLFFSFLFSLVGLPRDGREETLLVTAVTAVLVILLVIHYHLGIWGFVGGAIALWIWARLHLRDGEPWHPGLLDPPGYGASTDVALVDDREAWFSTTVAAYDRLAAKVQQGGMDARYLTDQQWLTLLRVVPRHQEAIVRFPLEPGDVAAVRQGNMVTIIEPNGKAQVQRKITAE